MLDFTVIYVAKGESSSSTACKSDKRFCDLTQLFYYQRVMRWQGRVVDSLLGDCRDVVV